MNKVILMGRLTKDPDVISGEKSVARFSLAVDRRYKKEGEQSADFISCVTFGKTAEFVEKYLKKGTKVVVTGEWRTGSYTNKDGIKVYTNDCACNDVEFAESKGSADNNSNSDGDFMEVQNTADMPF